MYPTTTDADCVPALPPPPQSRPTITLPPRPSAEAFFSGSGAGVSPGPMTLLSSYFSFDGGGDSDCRSFSQLLAGAMASPLAFGGAARLPFAADKPGENSGKEEQKSAGFKQSRPMNLVVARSPMFTIPPGLSPSGFLNSPGFFSPQVINSTNFASFFFSLILHLLSTINMLSHLAPPGHLDLNRNTLQIPSGPPSPTLSTTSFMSSVSWMAEKTSSELIPMLKNAYTALKDKEKGMY